MYNVFHGWHFMERFKQRSVVFKGPDPDEMNQPTEVERAQTQVAVRNFNEYLKDKPVIADYLKDINRDPAETARAIQGQAGADLAQKEAFVPGNPNAGMNPAAPAKAAGLNAKVMNDLGQDAIAQQAAARKGYVENAMGLQTSVNTAQQGMARDAVSRNITESEADYASNASTLGAVSSLAGAGAGMAYPSTVKKKA
ncbi:hypothetical protein UFOVP1419_42 [uncultured Caudovirales phage]|uniref:Uncharacterized protein n=1 Tax=uncultured Caudovirales phage TaxID=2100421 RepID=A0A6J5SDC4_9CAUD|nr:hypothetical protein UFOVP1419_42 [uncultured Caudovirales phage]